MRDAGLDGESQRVCVHPGEHEHGPVRRVGHDRRDQPVRVELRHERMPELDVGGAATWGKGGSRIRSHRFTRMLSVRGHAELLARRRAASYPGIDIGRAGPDIGGRATRAPRDHGGPEHPIQREDPGARLRDRPREEACPRARAGHGPFQACLLYTSRCV